MDRRSVDVRPRRLSLAVAVVDTVTDAFPSTPVRVRLVEGDEVVRAVRTPSGYAVFLDLPDRIASGPVTVVATGSAYLPERTEVDLSGRPVDEPVVLSVLPGPAYRFPPGETLVRGVARTADGRPVADATVTVDGVDRSTRTDRRGEFVAVVPTGGGEAVSVSDGRRLFRPNGTDPTVTVDHPEHGQATSVVTVTERDVSSTVIIYN